MSKRRNRSIRTLPPDVPAFFCHPPASPPFGEIVSPSSDDSVENILKNLKDLGTNSSSSSLSWGDEFKTESSSLVGEELKRMDRVLRGEEAIPANYDAEEYEEWMEFFPDLCSHGSKMPISHKIPSPAPDLSTCLKISSLGGASRLPKRQTSSRSLISSQVSSSKWLKDDEYSSLPFIACVKYSNTRTGRRKGILKNSLVLPPIETSPIRSISATPRRESKSLSALSVHKCSGNNKMFK